MKKDTKENEKIIKENLKAIGLDLGKIPTSLLNTEKIKYKTLKTYEDNNYKVYRYVNIKDIEILITPEDRLSDLTEKLRKAQPLADYLEAKDDETSELYDEFLNMVETIDLNRLEEIEEEQKLLNKNMPYEIRYSNNYIWQIYYSEVEDKYFMLYSSNERNSEALFYLIKKKLLNKKEMLYTPISHLEHSNKIFKKSEISDLENYLWFFTKEWPEIYEVYDKNDNLSIQILRKSKSI